MCPPLTLCVEKNENNETKKINKEGKKGEKLEKNLIFLRILCVKDYFFFKLKKNLVLSKYIIW